MYTFTIYKSPNSLLNCVRFFMSETAAIIGAVATLLGTAIAFFKFLFTSLATENKEYKDSLKKDYDRLQKKFDSILLEYLDIKANFSEIKLENDKLHREVVRLTDEVKKLSDVNLNLTVKESSYLEELGRLKQKLDEKDLIIYDLNEKINS